MKARKFFFIALLFSCVTVFSSEGEQISVVVVGGGPTGLASAIEAHNAGASVTIIEKRSAYTRENTLFLYTVTLEMFDRWQVSIPALQELYFREQRRGFVLIKDLEECLAIKVDELGIQKLQGEFIGFVPGEKTAIVHTATGEVLLAYDVLVGADGMHSRVREKLGISCTYFGDGIAAVVMVPATNEEGVIGVEFGNHPLVFSKKITIPEANVILMQNRQGMDVANITKQDLASFSHENGWIEDRRKIDSEAILHIDNIVVPLQHANSFSHRLQSVILVGDAAASASFFQGMGANYSFRTAEFAGAFIKAFPSDEAYDVFNQQMEMATKTLMDDSMPLFEQ